MQWIVDELFVGNHLAAGDIRAADGTAIDLRGVRSPIVVFCSRGDNITPPQQALGWILDLYDSVDDIRAWGQTIVYTIHDKVGHLGIFVSAGVARKEHDEFASNIDLIDVLPPGLYEAVLTPKGEAVDNPDLVTGEWVMRCEARTLDDIRALGGNDLADERKFEAAARLSEINLALYRAFVQPAVRAMVSPPLAEAMRRMHPLRLSYEMFSPRNPWMAWVATEAERVRGRRRPATRRQSARRSADARLTADRRGARRLAQGRGAPVRGHFPRHLRHAGAAGRAGHRRLLAASARARRRRASSTRRWSSAGWTSSGPPSAEAASPRHWCARSSGSAWRATPWTNAASRRSSACATPTRPASE